MSVCIFFGHRENYGLDEKILCHAIEELIEKGVDTFYVGHQGDFDRLVLRCLLQLKKNHQKPSFSVVLAYLPTKKSENDSYDVYSIYPEKVEMGHPKFAIERRNQWMIDRAHYCLCYVNHTWGGAYKFVCRAKRRGLAVINLGVVPLREI